PPATGPLAAGACTPAPRSAPTTRPSHRAWSKQSRSWPRAPTRSCWPATTAPRPARWPRYRSATACSAARWCCRVATARCGCARPWSPARHRVPTARCRVTPPATRWRRCCRCSRRWPAAATSPCSTPARAACCGWRSRMADPTDAAATPARLHRGNVAVVIPALNESLRIRDVVRDARTHCDHVIVVDDGSDDDTAERIADLDVTVLRHPRRMGKGAALRSGFAQARRIGARAVTTMDGDGQHSGADIPRLIDAANRHPGCVIVGARLRKRAAQPFYRRIGNDFGDWGIAWGCGFRVVDSQSGQRLYPHAVYTLEDVPGEG